MDYSQDISVVERPSGTQRETFRTVFCANCGHAMSPLSWDSEFCSRECAGSARESHRSLRPRPQGPPPGDPVGQGDKLLDVDLTMENRYYPRPIPISRAERIARRAIRERQYQVIC